jgi:excisionase family DNA binding protein
MNGILTVKQVAERLHVNRETVYRWLRGGKLTSYRANRLWRVSEQDLESFLRKRQEPAGIREAK